MKIIDFHSHAFPDAIAGKARDFLENYYKLPMYGTGTMQDLKAVSREGGITRIVVCSTATTPKQVTSINNWLSAEQAADSTLIALGSLHPDYPDIKGEVERIIKLGLHGVKLHPDFQQRDILDEGMLKIYEACSGKLPILMHVGDKTTTYSKPRKMAKAAELFPEQVFIAAHMGGYSEADEARECIIGKNIYIDTSSSFCVLNYMQMYDMIKAHGTDRVLFGTDYPLTQAKEELRRFMEIPLTDAERQDILYNNAAKLLGIKE